MKTGSPELFSVDFWVGTVLTREVCALRQTYTQGNTPLNLVSSRLERTARETPSPALGSISREGASEAVHSTAESP